MRNHFLCKLKDEGLIVVRWIPGDENEVSIFTKNTAAPIFERHIPKLVGDDEYMDGRQGA